MRSKTSATWFKRFAVALTLVVAVVSFQNCAQTQGFENAEDQASLAAPAGLPPSLMPTPRPTATPDTTVYSTCPTQTIQHSCPQNQPNCSCTDTLPAGRYDSDVYVANSATPTQSGGASCLITGITPGSYTGTVQSPQYGTCVRYCGVVAKCVGGQWTNIGTTW